ncbi:MAG: PLP-dependent aminotransferase family protein [Cyanobacteria bacterium P01_A01_bin.68]
MKIPLDRKSRKPIYLQIKERISRLIKSGALQPEERLPSIRSLAENLQVNKLTILEAYSILEADGIIFARQGSGYFVNKKNMIYTNMKSKFAPAQNVIISESIGNSFFDIHMSAVQGSLKKGTINFSYGLPRPPQDMALIGRRTITNSVDSLFAYDIPHGQAVLCRQIAKMLVQQGLEVMPENLIITNGCQQALSLTMQYYLQKGDWVIVETPTYHGAIAILENIGARIIGIPMNSVGMNLELLERYLKSHRPKLIYTISTQHNPTGIATSQSHRQKILQLTEKYRCPILEDNAYEGLNFEPVPLPIKALDKQDLVTYTGTFSKTLIPGLRVGYMVVTGKHYQPLLERKLMHDVHTSTISQAIVSEYLASGHYRRHRKKLQAENLFSRNLMLQAMERYFPQEAKWTVPKGGLFLWVQLPDNINISEIRKQAIEENILFASGSAFFPNKQGYPAMRLSFSNTSESEIDLGISILGKLLKKHLYNGCKNTDNYQQLS